MERSVPNYGWLRCTIPFLGTRRGDGATKAASLRSAAPSCSLADTLLRIHFEVLSDPLAAPKWEGGGGTGAGGGQKCTTLRQKLRGIFFWKSQKFYSTVFSKKVAAHFLRPAKNVNVFAAITSQGAFFRKCYINFQNICHDFFK